MALPRLHVARFVGPDYLEEQTLMSLSRLQVAKAVGPNQVTRANSVSSKLQLAKSVGPNQVTGANSDGPIQVTSSQRC